MGELRMKCTKVASIHVLERIDGEVSFERIFRRLQVDLFKMHQMLGGIRLMQC